MSKRRKNAGEGYGFMFSGAFSKKADAIKKEKETKGSFIRQVPTRASGDWRYVVMTPRENPRRRRKNRERPQFVYAAADESGRRFTDWTSLKESAARQAKTYGGKLLKMGVDSGKESVVRSYRRPGKRYGDPWRDPAMSGRWGANPMDLVVMGANPHRSAEHESALADLHEAQGKYLRTRAALAAGKGSEGEFIRAKREYDNALNAIDRIKGRENPGAEVVARPGETITIRVNPTQLAPAENSLGTFLGWAPAPPATRKQRAARRRAWKERVGAETKRTRAEYSSWRRSARASFKDKKKIEGVFHEVYGQNPAPICGARIGGYVCSRKPGHRGPHLPQGATLRPRSRHNWGPRGNPSAESIREYFTGRPADREPIYDEPHMPAGNYALLGKLLALYVKPRAGGQVLMIKGRGVQVVSDESARQIWFVAGDQDISAALPQFGVIDQGSRLLELGEARRIDYKQRKEHVPDPELDEWRHNFGEENGIRPTAFFDPVNKRLLLQGGDYRIEAEGIIN